MPASVHGNSLGLKYPWARVIIVSIVRADIVQSSPSHFASFFLALQRWVIGRCCSEILETLLQQHQPDLVLKLRELEFQPLQIAMPWIQFGFVSFLEADQVRRTLDTSSSSSVAYTRSYVVYRYSTPKTRRAEIKDYALWHYYSRADIETQKTTSLSHV